MDNTISFASYSENGFIDYWPYNEDEEEAAEEGRRRASELCELLEFRADAAILLPFIARAIAEKGKFGPMETAFYHRIAELH